MTGASRAPLTIEPFTPDAIDGAAKLLADRQRRHRLAEPALDPAHESPAVARDQIAEALSADGASGFVAYRDGAMVGYMLGQEKSTAMWGPNVWVEAAGHAAADPSIVRDLYAAAAAAWVEEGRRNHHVLVPATDNDLVEAWFSLDFGQQHIHAIREVPGPAFAIAPRSELVIRPARRDDLDALAALELVLPAHMRLSPVFSNLPAQTLEEARADLETDLDNPDYTYFVAEHQGAVVGSAIACALAVSSSYQGPNRPGDAGFLGFAAVSPEARGLGAGRALGESVLAWAQDASHGTVVTDWRSTNLEADRTWRALGFRPTFRRLHRLIG